MWSNKHHFQYLVWTSHDNRNAWRFFHTVSFRYKGRKNTHACNIYGTSLLENVLMCRKTHAIQHTISHFLKTHSYNIHASFARLQHSYHHFVWRRTHAHIALVEDAQTRHHIWRRTCIGERRAALRIEICAKVVEHAFHGCGLTGHRW